MSMLENRMVREILGPETGGGGGGPQNNCNTFMMIDFMICTAQQVLFR